MKVLDWGFWKLVVPTVLWLERTKASRMLFRPCRDVTQILSRSMDEPIGLREKLVLRIHFLYCHWCMSYGKQLEAIRQLAQKMADPEETEFASELRLSPEARRRIQNKLSSNDPQ